MTPSRRVITCASCGEDKRHASRNLCNACYKHHHTSCTLDKFPIVRERVSPRARYEGWVASGLRPKEYARQIGVWETSLSRSLRIERERRQRLGLPWLTGYRKEC